MATVKESWEQVGKDISGVGKSIKESGIGEEIAKFGTDLGKSIVKTVKHGIKAVSEWADSIESDVSEAEKACPDECCKAECAEGEVIYAEAAETVNEAAETVCENVNEAAETVCENVSEAVEEAAEAVCGAAEEAVEEVKK